MKRSLKVTWIALAALAGVSYLSFRAGDKPRIADLAFENMEALADGEDSSMFICFGSGEVDCAGAKVEVKYSDLR